MLDPPVPPAIPDTTTARALLNPRSIALIGASGDETTRLSNTSWVRVTTSRASSRVNSSAFLVITPSFTSDMADPGMQRQMFLKYNEFLAAEQAALQNDDEEQEDPSMEKVWRDHR